MKSSSKTTISCFINNWLDFLWTRYETSKLDLIEELLCRNMDHCAEYIFSLLDFEDQLNCLLVSRLWNDFISGHVFKRRVEYLGD